MSKRMTQFLRRARGYRVHGGVPHHCRSLFVKPANPLAAIPDGDKREWLLGWFDRDTREHGKAYVMAAHSDEAKRGYEADHPSREVRNIYEMPQSKP